MNKNEAYIKECSNYLDIMCEALKRDDFATYNAAKDMLDESMEERKEEVSLLEELDTNVFGTLHYIFEQAVPTVFKSNKKLITTAIKTIKEDKNLHTQFTLFKALNEYDAKESKSTPKEYVSALVEVASKDIDKKTVLESNKKFKKLLKESGFVPVAHVPSDVKAYYESVNAVITSEPKVSNMGKIMENVNTIEEYVSKTSNGKSKKVNPIDEMRKLEDKWKSTLTESEASFVQDITNFKSPLAEARKKKLFEKLKGDCVKKIDEMLASNPSNSSLNDLRSQISERVFNNETIVADIAKILEVRDILMDN